MEGRGRGRGFGRARGQPQGAPQQRPGGQQPRPGGQQPRPGVQQPRPGGQQQAAPPQSAWVRPMQPAASAWPRPQMAAPPQPQQPSGRGTRQEETGAIPKRIQGEGDGPGNEGLNVRGGSSVRGRVLRKEIVFTKPDSISSKQGSTGRPVNLLANYFPLLHTGKWCLFQYRVDMAPDIDHTGKRKGLVREATRDLFTSAYLFDGTVLYSPQRLPKNEIELFAKDGEETIRITIKTVGEVAWGDYHYLQVFNIMIRKCLALMGLKLIGRNYFMPENKVEFQDHKIELWPGYFTSMRQHERDILLNVDLQFKFLRTDNVLDMLMECQGANARNEFTQKVIGSVVLTYYNNKTYRVDDVDFRTTPQHTFKKADGSEISYIEYFKTKYNVIIRVRDQPMLVSRVKQREIRAGQPDTVYLVPELCNLTGLTDKQRDNFSLMKLLAHHTRVGVDIRIDKLRDFARKIHTKPEVLQEIKRWDLSIGDSLVQLQGRQLKAENILCASGGKYQANLQGEWTKDLRSNRMLYAQKMDRLAVICPIRNKSDCQNFIRALCTAAKGMNWNLGDPRIFEIQNDKSMSYLEQLERVINSANPTLVLVILPNNSHDRYAAVKRKCYVDRAVPSQVVLARQLTNPKGMMSVATKVVIQFNCKIGGSPWTVMIPVPKLMIVGYDVCRVPGQKVKSFAGIVASMDNAFSRYFSMAMEHKNEEELSDNFATFMVIACQKYKTQNGQFPEKICIYRDGVGDGQIPFVLEHEVELIKKKLKSSIYQDTELKMAFVIVSKRINTRLFLPPNRNPDPGTVVDDVITLPERYDFFIVSQCVKQGTVSPTSYNIIYDTMGLNPDKMQMLSHKLTHLYYNWSGTVRVPAPCQYAHKLAFLTSQSLGRPAHTDLESVLYYL